MGVLPSTCQAVKWGRTRPDPADHAEPGEILEERRRGRRLDYTRTMQCLVPHPEHPVPILCGGES